MPGDTLTPMMRQYRRIKSELADDVLLLFRMGDFYEMFFEDARAAAPLLNVALTQRGGVPMCGVPHHALDGYLARLIRAGRKAAICDQMEDPAKAKGIVRREVTRVVTPGTVTEDSLLEDARNVYLAAVHYRQGHGYGLAFLDLSTGEFIVETADTPETAGDLLRRTAPGEIVVAESLRAADALRAALDGAGGAAITPLDDWLFDAEAARDRLLRHFAVTSLDGFGCEDQPVIAAAAGAVLTYVGDTLRHALGHVRALRVCQGGEFLVLDEQTARNLDLLPERGRPAETTLLGVLDNTRTPMGARLMRRWLMRPSRQVDVIRARHDAVQGLCERRETLSALRSALGNVRDLERLIARIGTGRCNARDVRALSVSLHAAPAVRETLVAVGAPLLTSLSDRIHLLPTLTERIDQAIVENPPLAMRDGGIICPGYHAELDELRELASNARDWLARYQADEQERTGIRTLKVRHNKVFGYYIEVSRAQTQHVPEAYMRKQTLVNAERYITPELKDYEQRIVGAQERSAALEAELFEELRALIVAETDRIQETADAIAQADTLGTLSDRALALGYTRPEMHEGDRLDIREGRHPVIEQLPDAERFVPNDTLLDGGRHRLMVLTGPNMAGKSTYIRQVALIAVMAHMGSFVPATSARISLLDRVFTRVGASDDLARGRSTFMVEMQETANILHNATSRSLIVLDEIGRGTSTFDGISIAWAVAEHIHNRPHLRAKTLFATHYHELTELALTLDGVQNYSVQVKEQGESIAFLRRIMPGAADKSYGIHVARLAGLPKSVIDRANEILANLEEGELEAGAPKLARRRKRRDTDVPGQLMLFEEL